MASVLSDEKMDPNVTDRFGNTALIFAAEKGHEDVVRMLLVDKRVNVSQENQKGTTALVKAVAHGHYALSTVIYLSQCAYDLHDPEKQKWDPPQMVVYPDKLPHEVEGRPDDVIGSMEPIFPFCAQRPPKKTTEKKKQKDPDAFMKEGIYENWIRGPVASTVYPPHPKEK